MWCSLFPRTWHFRKCLSCVLCVRGCSALAAFSFSTVVCRGSLCWLWAVFGPGRDETCLNKVFLVCLEIIPAVPQHHWNWSSTKCMGQKMRYWWGSCRSSGVGGPQHLGSGQCDWEGWICWNMDQVELGMSKLGTHMGALQVVLCLCWRAEEGNSACRHLYSWRGFPTIPASLGHALR